MGSRGRGSEGRGDLKKFQNTCDVEKNFQTLALDDGPGLIFSSDVRRHANVLAVIFRHHVKDVQNTKSKIIQRTESVPGS